MFTKEELTQAKNDARPFINKCEAYRALLTEHDLPLSANFEELIGVIRSQQFAKLLAVDAGLKMRFEMLRTEEAQQKLIADTISLDGYEIVGQLEKSIRELQQMFDRLTFRSGPWFLKPEHHNMTLRTLARQYDLDLNRWLQSFLIDWTGKQHVLDYFTELGQQLSRARALVKHTRDTSATLQHVVAPSLVGYFTEASNQGPVEPNEHSIISDLIPKLVAQDKLAGFPGNMQ